MSRSRKKNPIIKAGRLFSRGEYNRRFRRINKIRIAKDLEPLKMDEVVNRYNVVDWRFLLFNYPDPKWLRK